MTAPPSCVHALPAPLAYGVKFVWQLLNLLFNLLFFLSKKPDIIMVQNPPGIPALLVCALICKLKGAQFIIDWHNYTYSILSLTCSSPQHPLVRVAYWWEGFWGRSAWLNLCVTDAMRRDLRERWNIPAVTLYDCPGATFAPISTEEKHNLWFKLRQEYPVLDDRTASGTRSSSAATGYVDATRFTAKLSSGACIERTSRPAVLISSTSWTLDEDFGMLLEALKCYDSAAMGDTSLPPIVAIITGKGPLKDMYVARIASETWEKVDFCTPWLEAEDYPRILASADLGVCLHGSSSGLDLPMKVVDMFGCCLPVLALNFPAIGELVTDGQNGLVFEDSQDLSAKLIKLLHDFPRNNLLGEFRENLIRRPLFGWDENWARVLWPLLEKEMGRELS